MLSNETMSRYLFPFGISNALFYNIFDAFDCLDFGHFLEWSERQPTERVYQSFYIREYFVWPGINGRDGKFLRWCFRKWIRQTAPLWLDNNLSRRNFVRLMDLHYRTSGNRRNIHDDFASDFASTIL